MEEIIGQIIGNKYRVIRPLGEGGQGAVYLVEDLHVRKYWAMKLWRRKNAAHVENTEKGELAEDIENREVQNGSQGIRNEINALQKLNHKNLPLIVDSIQIEERDAIIMEYIEGQNMEAYLRRNKRLDMEQVLQWGAELIDVIQYLHTRTPAFVYGDLKPANIMITKQGNLQLIDFGTTMEEAEYQKQAYRTGTYGYAAPELMCVAGGLAVAGLCPDARSDIYSLGVILHYMVTGRNPVMRGTELRPIREYDSTLSAGLELIIGRCLQKNPEERYQTCKELKKDIAQYKVLEHKYQWEYFLAYGTYVFLMLNAIGFMGFHVWEIAEHKTSGKPALIVYCILCAVTSYLIKLRVVSRKIKIHRYYKQEISILKTEKGEIRGDAPLISE